MLFVFVWNVVFVQFAAYTMRLHIQSEPAGLGGGGPADGGACFLPLLLARGWPFGDFQLAAIAFLKFLFCRHEFVHRLILTADFPY